MNRDEFLELVLRSAAIITVGAIGMALVAWAEREATMLRLPNPTLRRSLP